MKPKGVKWEQYLEECGIEIHRSRADQLIRIAEGRTTVQEERADTAERTAKSRTELPLRSGENADDPEVSAEMMKAAFADEGDSDEVCWRRGLLYRAENAAGEAAYEDWSGFAVDSILVDSATRAARAWTEVAAYLRRLRDAQSKSAEVEVGRQQLEIAPIAGNDPGPLPGFLRRTPKAAAS
jgi:hypothetical protein